MKLSRRMEIYRDDIIFGKFKNELIYEAKVLEEEVENLKKELKVLKKCHPKLNTTAKVCS